MRIVVFGSGGVGGYFGGRLALAGEDVTFIARGEHLRALKTTGLRIESPDGDFVIHPASAAADVSKLGPVDLIIMGVKAWQVPDAARAIKPIVGASTVVLPLQNGVDAPSQLALELGREPVVGGLCQIVSFVVEPGCVRHAGFEPAVTLGELNNHRTDRVEKIHRAFSNAGVKSTIAPDIDVALWRKFLFIAAFSGVGSVARVPAGMLRSVPETRALLVRAAEEIEAVARKREIRLPSDVVEQAIASVDRLPHEATSSMQRDITAGKPSELEAQNGAVVRMSRETGVPAPTHEFIYAVLKPLETKAREER